MLVTKKKEFSPITIVLQTQDEARELTGILHKAEGVQYIDKLWKDLSQMLAVPMGGLYTGHTKRTRND